MEILLSLFLVSCLGLTLCVDHLRQLSREIFESIGRVFMFNCFDDEFTLVPPAFEATLVRDGYGQEEDPLL